MRWTPCMTSLGLGLWLGVGPANAPDLGRVIANYSTPSNCLLDSLVGFDPSSDDSEIFRCWLIISSLWIALEATRGTLFLKRRANGSTLRIGHDHPAAILLLSQCLSDKRPRQEKRATGAYFRMPSGLSLRKYPAKKYVV